MSRKTGPAIRGNSSTAPDRSTARVRIGFLHACTAFFLAIIPGPFALRSEEPGIVLNEIHYHPKPTAIPGGATVPEEADAGEWVEIHNAGDAPRHLDGFVLTGGITFKFPPGTVLPAYGYAVVARSPEALRGTLEAFSDRLFGPFSGRLKNSGERLELRDEKGQLVDWVEYGDGPPWPSAPDGHGRTLELVHPSFDRSSAGSWAATHCEGGTPGAQNSIWTASQPPWIAAAAVRETTTGRHGHPPAEPLTIIADTGPRFVPARIQVQIQVVKPGGYIPLGTPEHLSTWKAVEMVHSSGSRYEAVIGPFEHRTLVRWRVEAEDDQGAIGSYPRRDDPVPHESLFVYGNVPGYIPRSMLPSEAPPGHRNDNGELEAAPVFFLLSRKEDIERLLSDKAAMGKDYPFTGSFVYKGRVWEPVEFRTRGGATRHELKKRNLKFRFPRGSPFCGMEGSSISHARRRLNLNRAAEHFGLHEALAYRLFAQAGILAPEVQHVHLRVISGEDENEDFFGLYLDVEELDRRFLTARGLMPAHFYKIQGIPVLKAAGGPPAQGIPEVIAFLQSSFDPAWVKAHVDLPRYLTFRAIARLTEAEDFGDRNYFLLKRAETGRWELIPSDLNGAFGVKRVNLADAFSRALPAHALEYEQYVAKLRSTILRAENVSSILADLLRRIGQLGNADSTRWRLAGKARPIQDPHAVSLWLRQHIRNLVSPLPTHKEKVAP